MEAEDEGGTQPGAVTHEEPPSEIALYPNIQDIEDRNADNQLKVDNSDENSVRRGSSPAPPVTGFNFWDVNSYKRTVKRIDDGAKLCDDLLKLLAERAEIEGLYAAKLQGLYGRVVGVFLFTQHKNALHINRRLNNGHIYCRLICQGIVVNR